VGGRGVGGGPGEMSAGLAGLSYAGIVDVSGLWCVAWVASPRPMRAGLAGLSHALSLHRRIDLFRQDLLVVAAGLSARIGLRPCSMGH
jgi:hypothetical protein